MLQPLRIWPFFIAREGREHRQFDLMWGPLGYRESLGRDRYTILPSMFGLSRGHGSSLKEKHPWRILEAA